MSLKLAFRAVRGEFAQAMGEIYEPIAKAGTLAIREAADTIKQEARADIASAGFGKRWQNTLRVDAYPRGGTVSANAAAFIHHKIPYAGVFEEGATIRGKPRLWIPMSHAPKKIGRQRMSARNFSNSVGRLQLIQRGNRPPVLAAKMAVSKTAAKKGGPYKVTLAALRKGANGQGTIRQVPLFVGVNSITIRKRFSIYQIIDRAAARLPELYLKNLEG